MEIPEGYTIRGHGDGAVDEQGHRLKRWQPLRLWGPGCVEALYWSNKLNIVSFTSLDAAIRFIYRHKEQGCDKHLALYCSICKSEK